MSNASEMKPDTKPLYSHLIAEEMDKQKYEDMLSRIEAQRAQATKDRLLGYWMPLATLAPILAALIAATGYILGKMG